MSCEWQFVKYNSLRAMYVGQYLIDGCVLFFVFELAVKTVNVQKVGQPIPYHVLVNSISDMPKMTVSCLFSCHLGDK